MKTSSTQVLLLFGSASSAASRGSLISENSRLHILLDGNPEITVISRGPDLEFTVGTHLDLSTAPAPPFDRILTRLGGEKVRATLEKTPLGRLLNSLGPLDDGRTFWRAVRRSPAARQAIARADVAIAGDLAAVPTAWHALRRKWISEAYYDHRIGSLTISANGKGTAPPAS